MGNNTPIFSLIEILSPHERVSVRLGDLAISQWNQLPVDGAFTSSAGVKYMSDLIKKNV